MVTTWAGIPSPYRGGYADGNRTNAKFYCPSGIAVNALGDVFVADHANYRIRKIDLKTGAWSVVVLCHSVC